MRVQLAVPCRYTKEMQPHRRMWIGINARHPRISRGDRDAQLFAQLAHQRVMRRLAGFDLAAGKFPIARPDFAGGTLGEEERAIWTLKDGGGDFDDFRIFG